MVPNISVEVRLAIVGNSSPLQPLTGKAFEAMRVSTITNIYEYMVNVKRFRMISTILNVQA